MTYCQLSVLSCKDLYCKDASLKQFTTLRNASFGLLLANRETFFQELFWRAIFPVDSLKVVSSNKTKYILLQDAKTLIIAANNEFACAKLETVGIHACVKMFLETVLSFSSGFIHYGHVI